VGTGWVSGDKIRLGGRCGSLTFPRPDLETGQPGEPLPDETWQAVEIKPRMCPDWFLYHSNFEGTWNVYLNRNDEAINISQGDNSHNIQPSYSDDAEWVAFTSDREISGNWEIYVTQPTSSAAPIRLTFNTGLDINPAWGP